VVSFSIQVVFILIHNLTENEVLRLGSNGGAEEAEEVGLSEWKI
jgi:hypothetical protein